MPLKINMFITNGNFSHPPPQSISSANLATNPKLSVKLPQTALNSSIIGRIHTVKPGCGSCGRH
jgi:hypothetical protein